MPVSSQEAEQPTISCALSIPCFEMPLACQLWIVCGDTLNKRASSDCPYTCFRTFAASYRRFICSCIHAFSEICPSCVTRLV